MLTDKQAKALNILMELPGIRAEEFARRMWGDTKTNMFTSRKNGGNGCQTGKAAWLCAGSYIGRLKKKGFARHNYEFTGYVITKEGKKALIEYKNK